QLAHARGKGRQPKTIENQACLEETIMADNKQTIRLAAIADIHYSRSSQGALHSVFEHVNDEADILALCGDLTDYGLPEEAHGLADELKDLVKIPVVAVLGNHDFESGKQEDVKNI